MSVGFLLHTVPENHRQASHILFLKIIIKRKNLSVELIGLVTEKQTDAITLNV